VVKVENQRTVLQLWAPNRWLEFEVWERLILIRNWRCKNCDQWHFNNCG